jgi:hypothetical protein
MFGGTGHWLLCIGDKETHYMVWWMSQHDYRKIVYISNNDAQLSMIKIQRKKSRYMPSKISFWHPLI